MVEKHGSNIKEYDDMANAKSVSSINNLKLKF